MPLLVLVNVPLNVLLRSFPNVQSLGNAYAVVVVDIELFYQLFQFSRNLLCLKKSQIASKDMG